MINDSSSNVIEEIILEADSIGAKEVQIIDNNMTVEIYALKGEMGVEIGKLVSNSYFAGELHAKLKKIISAGEKIVIDDKYIVNVVLDDSYGVQSYKLLLEKK